jgi:hypothetical protein
VLKTVLQTGRWGHTDSRCKVDSCLRRIEVCIEATTTEERGRSESPLNLTQRQCVGDVGNSGGSMTHGRQGTSEMVIEHHHWRLNTEVVTLVRVPRSRTIGANVVHVIGERAWRP